MFSFRIVSFSELSVRMPIVHTLYVWVAYSVVASYIV